MPASRSPLRPRRFLQPLALLTVLVLVPACQAPRIYQRPRVVQNTTKRLAAVLPGHDRSPENDLSYARLASEVETPGLGTPERLLSLANLADRKGSRSVASDPASARVWLRDAAAYAVFAIERSGAANDPATLRSQAIERHNHAVEMLLRTSGAAPKAPAIDWREQLASALVEVATSQPGGMDLPCEEVKIARDFRVHGMEYQGSDGLGVPLIAVSYYPDRVNAPSRFFPKLLELPATAVFRPSGLLEGGNWREHTSTLQIVDSWKESTVAIGNGQASFPLARDLSTPLAHQFLSLPLERSSWLGLLNPAQLASTSGVFMRAPHQPGKIPVLFVHGLWSSPEAWLRMTNRLQADPAIRDRYEFWYAYYPTGASLMVSAVRLRRELDALRATIDPGHSDPMLDQMVLVGHSLGGVLSRQFLQSSGRSLEAGLFTIPFDQVKMSPETREKLTTLMYFESVAAVRRAIFIAAPHRGSNTANQWIGRFTSALIRRPGDLEAIHDEIVGLNGSEVLTPAFRRRPPNSIDNLEPQSPILQTLSKLGTQPGVPYHSIIATLVPHAPIELWTDGVVPYSSAHLDGAESEVIVRHNHYANEIQESSAEVLRILREHLNERAEVIR